MPGIGLDPVTGRASFFQQRLFQLRLPTFVFLPEGVGEGAVELSIGGQLSHALLVFDGQGGTIGHCFVQAVGVDIVPGTELPQGVFVVFGNGGAGKGDEFGIGQAGPHKRRQKAVLTAVRFIHHHIKVGLGGEHQKIDLFPADLLPERWQWCASVVQFGKVGVAVLADKIVAIGFYPAGTGFVVGAVFIRVVLGGFDGFAIALLKLLHGAGENAAVVVAQHLL